MSSRVLRFVSVLAGLAAIALAAEAYGILPARFDVVPLPLPAESRHVTLIFHGSGGREEPTLIALEQRLRGSGGDSGTMVVRYDWSPWSDDRFRTYPNGIRVGRSLGAALARLPQLASIHLIAHSAGAYVLEPLCEAYRASATGGTAPARVRMTYLDPIGFRGALDPGWGARNYGRCADDAEAFINTDDPAPATASVLEHARTMDVTRDRGRKSFTAGGHRWPVQYYINHLTPPDDSG